MKLVILGAPGAGKGTQATRLSEKYRIPRISTGDLLRANISEQSALGLKAKAFVDAGQLVPDDLVIDLLMDRIGQKDCKSGYVLDGFPRTIPQADALYQALADIDSPIEYVIDVDVPDNQIVERMGGRRACLDCGATFHVKYNPPKEDDVCDICGAVLVLRKDDNPETVKDRLQVYHQQTEPLIEYYSRLGLLSVVDGTIDIDDVFTKIIEIIGG